MLTMIINMDNSLERWKNVHSALQNLEINATRISAVNGKTIPQEEINKISYSLYDSKVRALFTRELTRGEYGCFLSHRKCWEQLLASNEQYAVIMEDDIIISPRIKEYISNTNWLPSNIKICQLSATTDNDPICINKEITKLITGDLMYHVIHGALGTQCYIISREVAEFALQNSKKIPAPVDDFLFSPKFEVFKNFGTHRIHPVVTIQNEKFESTIGSDRFFKREKAPFWIRHGLRHFCIRLKIAIKCRSGMNVTSVFR